MSFMQRKQADILLSDISGLAYAAMYQPALAKLSFDGKPTGGIHGALQSLLSSMQQQPSAVPIVIWDGRADWRYDLFEGYKSNRKDTPEKLAIRAAYRKQLPIIQLMLTLLGIPQVRCATAEADDVGGHLCRELDPSWAIELAAKDYDWVQGVRSNCHYYSPAAQLYLDLVSLNDPNNGFRDGHFESTELYVRCKALSGDDSDTIPGIKGVGMSTAHRLLTECGGDIESFWNAVDAGMKPKGVIASRVAEQESREIYRRNLKLMDWSQSPALHGASVALTYRAPAWTEAEDLADEFGLSKVFQSAQRLRCERGWDEGLIAVDRALHSEHCIPVENKRRKH